MLLWKLHTLDHRIASVRYRALLPIQALSRRGYRSFITKSLGVDQLRRVEAAIFVKSFALKDLLFAQRASEAGAAVVLDLCDNIFVPNYGVKGSISPAEVIQAMARYAAAVTTTGPALADVLKKHLEIPVPVMTVVDGIEEKALSVAGRRMLRRAQITELRRMLTSIAFWIRVTPKLKGKVAAQARRWWAQHAAPCFPIARRPGGPADHGTNANERGGGTAERTKTLIWFGHSGGDYGRFGLLDLVDIGPHLEQLSRRIKFKLIVVSNNRDGYHRLVQPLAIDTRYVEWESESVRSLIQESDLTIIPNSRDPFAICKSANRAVLSLSLGVPVVASRTPAMEALRNCVTFDDWLEGSYRYLTDPKFVADHLQNAQRVLETEFGSDRIGGQWEEVLTRVRHSQHQRAGEKSAQARRPTAAVVIHLVQDLDLALPLLAEIARSHTLQAQAWVSLAVLEDSPRVWKALRRQQVDFLLFDDQTDADLNVTKFQDVAAVITIAETNQSPHRFPHRIATRANELGVPTYTVQHGFENIGLTYTDKRYPIEQVSFASKTIFIWGPQSLLHPGIPESTRAKCVPVGCWKAVPSGVVQLPVPVPSARTIGIFENLHWDRYDTNYVERFVADTQSLALRYPELIFLVKPHHAGQWLTSRYRGAIPKAPNLVVADPAHPEWEQFTASQLISSLDGVITTPSTVALDAARAGKPVAVVGYELDLSVYRPLPILTRSEDWMAFLHGMEDDVSRRALVDRSRAFVQRTVCSGAASADIVRKIAAPLMTRAPLEKVV